MTYHPVLGARVFRCMRSVACDIPQIVVCDLRHLASIAYGLAEPHRARRSLLLRVKLPGSVNLGTEPE